MTVNISATFTKEERPRNGLDAIADKLVDEQLQHAQYVVVATVSPKFVKLVAEDGTKTPTIRFDAIEVLEEQSAIDAARQLLVERYQERTGHDPQLPLSFGVDGPDGDGEREVPEASGEELLAERREAREAEQADGGGTE